MSPREQALLGAMSGVVAALFVRDLDLTTLVSFWGDRTLLLPLGAIVGAMCGRTRFRPALHTATVLLALLWIAVAYTPVSRTLAEGLARRDPLAQADAVLVLSSRMQTDGDPTSAQLSRVLRGVELVKDGFAPRLMVSELPPPFAPQRPFIEAMLTRFEPGVELVVFQSVRSTRDEAIAAADYMKARGLGRIIVTSSPTHMLRAAALLEKLGLTTMAAPATETTFDLETLDRPEERVRAFGPIIHERLGLIVYRRRGWID